MSSPNASSSWDLILLWCLGWGLEYTPGEESFLPSPDTLFSGLCALSFAWLVWSSRRAEASAAFGDTSSAARVILPVFYPLLYYLITSLGVLFVLSVGVTVASDVQFSGEVGVLAAINTPRWFLFELTSVTIGLFFLQPTISKKSLGRAALPAAVWAGVYSLISLSLLLTFFDHDSAVPHYVVATLQFGVAFAYGGFVLLGRWGRPALRPFAWFQVVSRSLNALGLLLSWDQPPAFPITGFIVVFLLVQTVGFTVSLFAAIRADTFYWRGLGRRLPSTYRRSTLQLIAADCCGMGDIGVGFGLRGWGEDAERNRRHSLARAKGGGAPLLQQAEPHPPSRWLVGWPWNWRSRKTGAAPRRSDPGLDRPGSMRETGSGGASPLIPAGGRFPSSYGSTAGGVESRLEDEFDTAGEPGDLRSGTGSAAVGNEWHGVRAAMEGNGLAARAARLIIIPYNLLVGAGAWVARGGRKPRPLRRYPYGSAGDIGSASASSLEGLDYGPGSASPTDSSAISIDVGGGSRTRLASALSDSSSRLTGESEDDAAAANGGMRVQSLDSSLRAWAEFEAFIPDDPMSDLMELLEASRGRLLDFAFVRLEEVVHHGGVAAVFRGWYKRTRVAVKVFKPMEFNSRDLAGFAAEVSVSSCLSHPHIARMIGLCCCPPDVSMVLEWCGRGTMRDVLDSMVKATAAARSAAPSQGSASPGPLRGSASFAALLDAAHGSDEEERGVSAAALGTRAQQAVVGQRYTPVRYYVPEMVAFSREEGRPAPPINLSGVPAWDIDEDELESFRALVRAGKLVLAVAPPPEPGTQRWCDLPTGTPVSVLLASTMHCVGGKATDARDFPVSNVEAWDVSDVAQFATCWQFEPPRPGPGAALLRGGVGAAPIPVAADPTLSTDLPWLARLRICAEVASALAYMHDMRPAPILHRDLKSLNILLTEEGVAKLCDFGDSKGLKPGDPMTGNKGTPNWMAPEVVSGGAPNKRGAAWGAHVVDRVQSYTQSADVYSLTCVLWELATGGTPFAPAGRNEIMEVGVSLHGRPPIPPAAPRAFAHLLRTGWHWDPALRPPAAVIAAVLGRMYHRARLDAGDEERALDPLMAAAAAAAPQRPLPPPRSALASLVSPLKWGAPADSSKPPGSTPATLLSRIRLPGTSSAPKPRAGPSVGRRLLGGGDREDLVAAVVAKSALYEPDAVEERIVRVASRDAMDASPDFVEDAGFYGGGSTGLVGGVADEGAVVAVAASPPPHRGPRKKLGSQRSVSFVLPDSGEARLFLTPTKGARAAGEEAPALILEL